jgi:hypothetical protein
MQAQSEYSETRYFMTQQDQDAVIMKAIRNRPAIKARLASLGSEAAAISDRLTAIGKALKHPSMVFFDEEELPEELNPLVSRYHQFPSSYFEEFKRIPILVRDYRKTIAELQANTRFLEEAGVKELR